MSFARFQVCPLAFFYQFLDGFVGSGCSWFFLLPLFFDTAASCAVEETTHMRDMSLVREEGSEPWSAGTVLPVGPPAPGFLSSRTSKQKQVSWAP